MLPLLLTIASAWAGGIHLGIPVQGLPALGAPTFDDPELGWSAPLPGPDGRPMGVVRVYVGPTQAAAAAWMADSARAIQRPLSPVPGLGDSAFGVGALGVGAPGGDDALLLVQDGNVAFQVLLSAPGPAEDLARTLLGAIVDGDQPWPAAPGLRREGALWHLASATAVGWQVVGGRQPLGEQGFIELPERVVTWDAWGRFAVLIP